MIIRFMYISTIKIYKSILVYATPHILVIVQNITSVITPSFSIMYIEKYYLYTLKGNTTHYHSNLW